MGLAGLKAEHLERCPRKLDEPLPLLRLYDVLSLRLPWGSAPGRRELRRPGLSQRGNAVPPREVAVIQKMLAVPRLAIVGLSDDPTRPSRNVARYLKDRGKQIVPINPNFEELLGETSYPDLVSVPEPPAVAIVFRRPEACPAIVRDAIQAGVRGIWLQQGITSYQCRQLALDHGLDYIEDRCYKVELMLARR